MTKLKQCLTEVKRECGRIGMATLKIESGKEEGTCAVVFARCSPLFHDGQPAEELAIVIQAVWLKNTKEYVMLGWIRSKIKRWQTR